MKTIHPASPARGFATAFCLSLSLASAGFAQNSSPVPVVTIQATDNHGTWAGNPAVFTVFRSGNSAPDLSVYCCIGGTATNGVDYQAIGSFVSLPAGVLSNSIVIKPINLGQTDTRTARGSMSNTPTI